MGRRYRSFSTFSPHDSNTICDVTGFKVKYNQVVRRWEGFQVIPEAFHPRQPQDFPVIPVPQVTYPIKTEQVRADCAVSTEVTEDVIWTQKSSGVSGDLLGIWEESGMWVAVGLGGLIITSSDSGNTWTQRTSGTVLDLTSVKYWTETSTWYVTSHNTSNGSPSVTKGKIFKSTDGINWSELSLGIFVNQRMWHDIEFDNSIMVFGGWNDESQAELVWTSDGTSFTRRGPDNQIYEPRGVSWNQDLDQWVITGSDTQGSYLSGPKRCNLDTLVGFPVTSFINDQKYEIAVNMTDVDYNGSTWIATRGDGQVLTSSDGLTWLQRSQDIMTSDIPFRVTHNPSGDIMVCGGNVIGKIMTSSNNGATWTSSYTADTTVTNMSQAHYGENIWIAVGYNGRIVVGVANSQTVITPSYGDVI